MASVKQRKTVRFHPTEAFEGSRSKPPRILNIGARYHIQVSDHCTFREGAAVPMEKEAGWAP